MTQSGGIPALHVPKLRRGNGALTWQTSLRYDRGWGALLDQPIMGYCLGLSLRDLQEVMQGTRGERMSLAACNRLVLTVQEQSKACKTTSLAACRRETFARRRRRLVHVAQEQTMHTRR